MRAYAVAMLVACSFQHGVTGNGLGSGSGSDGSGSSGSAGSDAAQPPDDGPRALDAKRDASSDLCVQSTCALAGGTCTSGTCVITVITTGDVTCPDDMPCRINCTTETACKSGTIECGQATSCIIDCQQMNSCQGDTIDCRNAGCTVDCRVDNTCMNDSIGCGSQTCEFECCADSNTECKNNSGDTPTYTFTATCPPQAEN